MMTLQEQTSQTAIKVTGIGLVTGLEITAQLSPLPAGTGIVFDVPSKDGQERVQIPARLACIADATRGVTLGHPSGAFVSIVEHFLCASAVTNRQDVLVTIDGGPELPLLDGSSQDWVEPLMALPESPMQTMNLTSAVRYQHNDDVHLYALPSDHFEISYAVNFDHPELANRWIHWDSESEDAHQLLSAQTFGFVRELPALQQSGLAKGVSEKNTLGLMDNGGFTRPLRFELEPVTHKALDLIGDLSLMGINPMGIKAHVFAFNAGHASHTAFASKLLDKLQPAQA
jgi:UDP-3-O-[3-hydroxymyristoyl] N-acetylglucosamine deacetylase